MRDRVVIVLLLLGLAAGGWWYSANSEWVEKKIYHGERGEARENPVYAYEQLLRRLGMHTERHQVLDAMPPANARLILLSDDWNLLPGRSERLQQWVQQGGHLVLVASARWDETPLKDWVPVRRVDVDIKTLREEREAAKAAAEAARALAARLRAKAAETAASSASAASDAAADDDDEAEDDEDDQDPSPARYDFRTIVGKDALMSTPPFLGEINGLAPCNLFDTDERLRVAPGQTVTWTVTQRQREQIVRVAMGQGSVTVLNADDHQFWNWRAVACNNPLILSAVVQAEPGATVWIYLNETREPLLAWLWHKGWIAVLTGALALVAVLWRASVRFGPRVAPAPRLRRSIGEQVRGLGVYLFRHGREALLAAQQRALDEAAARRVRGYARLTLPDRARAIAEATGVERQDLLTAMTARTCTRAELAPRLQRLEAARRRLLSLHDERPSQ